MVPILKDYLRSKAKCKCLAPTIRQTNVLDVNERDIKRLPLEWKAAVARHDPNMVDSLIQTVDDYLGDRPLPERLQNPFETFEDVNGGFRFFGNSKEADARYLVEVGALSLAWFVLHYLGCSFDSSRAQSADGFRSKVDFVYYTDESAKVLAEVKDPSVLEKVLPTLKKPAVPIAWLRDRPPGEKVLNTVCQWMGSHKARWLALTSHEKWVYFRLHDNIPEPYITYSNVECLADNNRPVRAFIGMMLATALDIEVESKADMTVPVPPLDQQTVLFSESS